MANGNPILSKVQPTTMAAPSETDRVQAIEQALATSEQRLTQLQTSAQERVAKTDAATDVITSAISDLTTARQIEANAKGAADLQAQNATIATFEAAGGTDTQVLLMEALRQDGERVAALLDEKADIVDDEHTGISFIDTIINGFRSVGVDEQLAVAEAQQAQTVSQIQNISAATESFARQNALTKKTLNEASIQANYNAIAAEGNIKLAEAELKNLHSNAAALAELATADSRIVANRLQLFRLENEVEQVELTRERHVLQREQMKVDREKLLLELPRAQVELERAKLALDEAKDPKRKAAMQAQFDSAVKTFEDAMAAERQMISAVQQGQSLVGLPIEDSETIAFKLKNPATRERYFGLQEVGGTSAKVIGLSPFEAKATLDELDPLGTAEKSKGVALLDQVTKIQADAYKGLPKNQLPSTPEALAADYNKTAADVYAAWNLDIKTGDQSNPLHAPPMDTLVANAAVQADPFYQTVLAPKAMKEVNPQVIMESAVDAIKAKTISPEAAAAGIDLLFTTAADYNNTLQGGFKRVGLPNQTQYNVSIRREPTAFEKLRIATGAPSAIFSATARAFLGDKEKAAEGLADKLIKDSDFLFMSVDLMDSTKVKNTLVQMLSTSKVPSNKQQSEEPSTSPAAKTP